MSLMMIYKHMKPRKGLRILKNTMDQYASFKPWSQPTVRALRALRFLKATAAAFFWKRTEDVEEVEEEVGNARRSHVVSTLHVLTTHDLLAIATFRMEAVRCPYSHARCKCVHVRWTCVFSFRCTIIPEFICRSNTHKGKICLFWGENISRRYIYDKCWNWGNLWFFFAEKGYRPILIL